MFDSVRFVEKETGTHNPLRTAGAGSSTGVREVQVGAPEHCLLSPSSEVLRHLDLVDYGTAVMLRTDRLLSSPFIRCARLPMGWREMFKSAPKFPDWIIHMEKSPKVRRDSMHDGRITLRWHDQVCSGFNVSSIILPGRAITECTQNDSRNTDRWHQPFKSWLAKLTIARNKV